MPRVYLTAEQREAAAIQRLQEMMADGLAVRKRRSQQTYAEMGRDVGITGQTMSRLMAGQNPRMTVSQVFCLMRMAGLTVSSRKEAVGEGESQ